MNRVVIVSLLVAGLISAQTMVVRIYCRWDELARISPKYNLDIATGRANEWYDIVADRNTMDRIIASGLPYEVQIYSLELEKEKVRGQYYSYDQYVQMMRQMAQTYPSICKLDSLPIRTYQNRWIYGVKISDNPGFEDPTEPGFLVDGCHHAREWATPFVVYKFCDSITKVYATNNEIRQIVDNIEIYAFPVINVDGYVYDYPSQLSWRKNREPFGGATGTDPNRNYGGCSDSLAGEWGAVDRHQNEASHYPSSEVFCGAYAYSGDEIRALTMYARSKIINAYMSYHSYSEYLMWGWGWTTADIPDGAVCARFGNRMAGMINRLSGGTYTPGQIPEILYYVSGGSIDWLYSWCHWVGGIANLSYTTEIGTAFYQNTSQLDAIFYENFKALKYLAQLCRDSIPPLIEGKVAPPQIYPIGNVGQNFAVRWHPVNPSENHPTQWELVELSNPSVIEDNLESGSGRWVLQGFSLSTAQHHSGSYSLFSGNTNNMNSAARTLHPYLVQSGDSLSFWCYYNLENNYDVAVVEVSENTKEWFNLDTMRFTGTQTSWVRKAYSLANWVGKSVYFRFRSMTDGNTLNGGFYVDDIRPVCLFNNVNVIANNITDTMYTFTNHAVGEYYYYVRGYNTAWGWGEYSCLAKANVGVGISEDEQISSPTSIAFNVNPNPFQNHCVIKFQIPSTKSQTNSKSQNPNGNVGQGFSLAIYDVTGRMVKDFSRLTVNGERSTVVWNGSDDLGRRVPTGVYFVRLEAGDYKQVEKAILLR
ncbi:MAG: M14 family zinc carboxypeptidase [candidate division WOR-3 bacterium]